MLYELDVIGDLGIMVFELGETGISTNGEFEYDSLYYDDETGFIFYSCYNGSDEVTLYAIADYYNSETGDEFVEAYSLGQFASKVWPVSGLYQFDSENSAVNKERTIAHLESNALLTEKAPASSLARKTSSMRKQPAVSAKEEPVVETPAEDVSENEAAPVEEAPAEDVSENEAAPAEDVSENETAPVEETPAEDVSENEEP